MSLGVGIGKEQRRSQIRGRNKSNMRAEDGDVVALSKKTTIFSEGNHLAGLWEIIEGSVIVYKTLAGERRQITEIATSGCLLGSHSGELTSCSAQTLTRCRLKLHQPSEIAASPSLQSRIIEYQIKRIGDLQEHALLLGRKSALERVATFLLSLPSVGVPLREPNREDGDFVVALSQRDIGDYLGLKVETVCRILVKLKRLMIIATGKRGHFRLLDSEALRRLAVAG